MRHTSMDGVRERLVVTAVHEAPAGAQHFAGVALHFALFRTTQQQVDVALPR